MLTATTYLTDEGKEVSSLFFSTFEEAEEVKNFFDDSVELEIQGGFLSDEDGDERKGYFLFSCFQQEEEEQPDETTLKETGVLPAEDEEGDLFKQ